MKTKILAAILLLTTSLFYNAYSQVVTIPDPEFVSYLQTNYPSCITGNQLETSCPDILNATEIYLPSTITDLFGVQFFLNASLLETSGAVTNIIDFPPNLGALTMYNAELTSLPDFPPTLTSLQLSYMPQLVNVPDLPLGMSSLIIYECYSLEELPDLSGGVIFASILNCPLIDSIPALPDDMTTFEISGCPLVGEIPNLPPNLGELLVENLPLVTTIPDLPVSLFEFWCVSNDLYTLPDLHEGLQYAVFYGNLNLKCLPVLPQSLLPDIFSGMEINLTQTQITCLPNIPPALDPAGLEICSENDLVNNPHSCNAYIGITEIATESITVYPNPSTDIFNFVLPLTDETETVKITLCNIMGETVFDIDIINSGTNTLDISFLSPGYYLIQVITSEMQYNTSFVKS